RLLAVSGERRLSLLRRLAVARRAAQCVDDSHRHGAGGSHAVRGRKTLRNWLCALQRCSLSDNDGRPAGAPGPPVHAQISSGRRRCRRLNFRSLTGCRDLAPRWIAKTTPRQRTCLATSATGATSFPSPGTSKLWRGKTTFAPCWPRRCLTCAPHAGSLP